MIKMDENMAMGIIDKIFGYVFGVGNHYSLEEIMEKFAFDVKLPKMVYDSTTHEVTWADSIHNGKFITLHNMEKRDQIDNWLLPRREITNLDDLIQIWDSVNFMTTERIYDSVNISKSDTIYGCCDVYHSTGCSDSKKLVYCDSCCNSEYLLASQRSGECNFCIRCDDSKDCSNSYSVICSSKVSNCLFIQDCFDIDECMFCSHIANKRYYIANMPFEKEEYYEMKRVIIKWILSS